MLGIVSTRDICTSAVRFAIMVDAVGALCRVFGAGDFRVSGTQALAVQLRGNTGWVSSGPPHWNVVSCASRSHKDM